MNRRKQRPRPRLVVGRGEGDTVHQAPRADLFPSDLSPVDRVVEAADEARSVDAVLPGEIGFDVVRIDDHPRWSSPGWALPEVGESKVGHLDADGVETSGPQQPIERGLERPRVHGAALVTLPGREGAELGQAPGRAVCLWPREQLD